MTAASRRPERRSSFTSSPSSLFVADFIGDANLVDAELVEERGERALIRLGDLDLDLARRGARKGPVKLAVRSEGVTLHAARPAGPALAGRVTKASYLGKHLEYTVDTVHGSLFVVDHLQTHPIAARVGCVDHFRERGTIVMPGEGEHVGKA